MRTLFTVCWIVRAQVKKKMQLKRWHKNMERNSECPLVLFVVIVAYSVLEC